jgi:hypothetical protein
MLMKLSRKLTFTLITVFLVGFLAACQNTKTVCAPVDRTPKPAYDLEILHSLTPVPRLISDPITVEINGKMKQVDKLVDYPICNDHWSGIVYVSCDAEVGTSEIDVDENPLFFKDCQLTIEPDTIVYVADHNDTAYYKGCSCHTGKEPVQ